jgi:hypothetical protein
MFFTLQVHIMQIVKICELTSSGARIALGWAPAVPPAVSQPGRVSAQLNILAV